MKCRLPRSNRRKPTNLADQDKLIFIAEKSKAQSDAEKLANEARALATKAEEQVKTAREKAIAEREKQIALVAAEQEARQQAIGVRFAAEAEKDAAQNQAHAVKIKAEAQRVQYQVEANGIELRIAALNTLDADQIAMQIKMKLFDALPGNIEAFVKAMEKIDSIKIIQVDGLDRPSGGNSGHTMGSGSGNLAEQALTAALTFRRRSTSGNPVSSTCRSFSVSRRGIAHRLVTNAVQLSLNGISTDDGIFAHCRG